MVTNNKIRYQIHIPIICGLLFLQFFVTDIFSAIFLPAVERKLKNTSDGTFYKKGQYTPLSEDESPKDYVFVLVSRSNNTITETYYTKKTDRIRVTYIDGKWHESEHITFSNFSFMALPMVGFLLFMSAILHKMARTGAIITWTLRSYPDDNFEKLCKLYGIPIFASAILFGWLGRV